MVQRVAMHVIRLMKEPGKRATDKSPAVSPTYLEVQPGTLFEVPAENLEELENSNPPAVVKATDKRASKFGYGTIAAQTVEQEEGETDESAGRRRRMASRRTAAAPAPAAAGKRGRSAAEKDLVG